MRLLMTASQPEKECWYIAPTYRQAKLIAWRKLKALVPQRARRSANETELTIELTNGSVISLKGADNPDSLRGPGLDDVVLDEFAQIKEDVWTEVIRPALADKQGRALFIGTPDGMFNLAKKIWDQVTENREVWGRWRYTTLEGGNVTAAELADIAKTLDPRTYRQEMEASFESVEGLVYYAYDRNLNNCFESVEGDEPLHIGMDFNVGKMAAVVNVIRGGYPCAVDEFVSLLDTPHMIAAIRERYPGNKVYCYPDASGGNRKSENASTTDIAQLKQAGFTVVVDSTNPRVKDRVASVNAAFLNSHGERRYKINALRCPTLVSCLLQQVMVNGEPDKKMGFDHLNDCIGYLCSKLLPIRPTMLPPAFRTQKAG